MTHLEVENLVKVVLGVYVVAFCREDCSKCHGFNFLQREMFSLPIWPGACLREWIGFMVAFFWLAHFVKKYLRPRMI